MGSNANIGYFADWNSCYVRQVGDVVIEVDRSRYFDTDQLGGVFAQETDRVAGIDLVLFLPPEDRRGAHLQPLGQVVHRTTGTNLDKHHLSVLR